jgi:hypothetical protein
MRVPVVLPFYQNQNCFFGTSQAAKTVIYANIPISRIIS